MVRQIIRYSEAFKLQVIGELESGNLVSIESARRRYDIGGASTIQKWLKKYGKNELVNKVVIVQTPKDRDQVQVMKKRIRELEKALAATQVTSVLNQTYFEIACEHGGIDDPEGFKKKLDTEL